MSKLVSTITLTGIPIVVFAINLIAVPGYIMPVFYTPLGIGVLIFSVVWLAIGAFLLMITKGFLRVVMCLLFPFPVTFLLNLAPAIVTISQALDPVILSK